jgi:hypothetical protein
VSAAQGTDPTQGTPTGGQCSRGSPQAAGTSLPDQPRRATTRLTVFSFVARRHGECGSQKKMSISASTLYFHLSISGPWSHVSEARSKQRFVDGL